MPTHRDLPMKRRPRPRYRRKLPIIIRTFLVLAIGISIGAWHDRIPALERLVDTARTAGFHVLDRAAQGSKVGSRGGTSGNARVIDGDTIDIGGSRIRLHGIDAPESGQACTIGTRRWNCGLQATAALRGLIGGRPVHCTVSGRDRYGREIGVCSVSGTDINAWMVSGGWALAYRRYSRDYIRREDRARAGRLGIWRGKFVKPWDWRRGARL